MSFLSPRAILEKKGWRRDIFWTNFILNTKLLRRIPFNADVYALEKSQYWSRAEIDGYAEARIRALMVQASALPLWKAIFAERGIDPTHATMEDFRKLPFISKKNFTPETVDLWTDTKLRARSFTDHTSGSTGRPFDFFIDKGFELRAFAICERMLRAAAGGTRPWVISLRVREKLGFVFFKHTLFFVENYNSIKYRLAALTKLVQSVNSEVILYGFPSAFVELAHRVQEAGVRMSVRAAVSTGESIRPAERELIETNLNTKFYTNYATRELGWLAFECEHHTLHLNEEWGLVEIIDDSGNVLPDGSEGNVVVTVYENSVMPTLRYQNGDRATISASSCPCGRTLRSIKVSGRQIELIRFEDGRLVSLLDLGTIFDWYAGAVKQFQIQQTGPYEFHVRIIPGHAFSYRKQVLEEKLLQILHLRARVTWEEVIEIPAAKSGKAVYFIGLTPISK